MKVLFVIALLFACGCSVDYGPDGVPTHWNAAQRERWNRSWGVGGARTFPWKGETAKSGPGYGQSF